MAFDHELKIRRAFNHLHELDGLIKAWLHGSHHSVRQERDPKTGEITVLATAEQPPVDQFSLLIGDSLHNLRSALDTLAFALARAYTKPLPDSIAESSEFPIFGDEDRQGNSGVGSTRFHQTTKKGDPAPPSGLAKIRGWDPAAQAIVEGLQPYHRGNSYRTHPPGSCTSLTASTSIASCIRQWRTSPAFFSTLDDRGMPASFLAPFRSSRGR